MFNCILCSIFNNDIRFIGIKCFNCLKQTNHKLCKVCNIYTEGSKFNGFTCYSCYKFLKLKPEKSKIKVCKICNASDINIKFDGFTCYDCKNEIRKKSTRAKIRKCKMCFIVLNKISLSYCKHCKRKKYLTDKILYNIKNKDKIKDKRIRDKSIRNKKVRNMRKSNMAFKLREKISGTIRSTLLFNNSSKKGSSILEYLSYTIQDLKQHIEFLFESWMNWKNWGRYIPENWKDDDPSTWIWQLDHIIPQSKLPYDSMEHENFKKCWSLENLRPYSAKQNILDGNRR